MTLAIVFDLDDTLYPERSFNFSGFSAVGEHVLRKHGVAGFGLACEELFHSGARADIFDRAVREMGLALEVPALVAAYREHEPKIALFDDAREVLDALHGRYPLALLSDGYSAVQRRKLKALGIESMFDSIVISDDFGRAAWKPSDVPYRRTMERLAGKADRFVYIADNPLKDFVTARALGWDTVMVRRPGGIHAAVQAAPGHAADSAVESLRDIAWERLGTSR